MLNNEEINTEEQVVIQENQNEEQLPNQLTDEELRIIEEKVLQLETMFKVKVHPVVFIHPETKVRKIGYVQEPNYATKVAMMDKSMTVGPYAAGDDLRQMCLLRDHSDPMFYADVSAADEYKMGCAQVCMDLVSMFRNQFKKK